MDEEHEENQRPLGCFAFLRRLLRLFKKKKSKKTKDKNHDKENMKVKSREEEEEGEKKNDEQENEGGVRTEDVEDDGQFLRRHVAFLTREQLHSLGDGRPLGEGAYGSVKQLTYHGTEAVVKELLDDSEPEQLLKEARVLAELDGAGGVPRLLAVCQTPPALVQEFLGQTYNKYLVKCSVRLFLRSLDGICHQLRQVHAKGFVHNDLKMNNITFTGAVGNPEFHIIDFGVACRVGEALVEEPLDLTERKAKEANKKAKQAIRGDTIEDFLASLGKGQQFKKGEDTKPCAEDSEDEAAWMAPEVLAGEQVLPSGDVYSFGYLLECLTEDCRQNSQENNCLVEEPQSTFLGAPLMRLSHLCTQWDPRRRPSLAQVSQAVEALAEHLSARQLAARLHFQDDDE